MVRVTMACTPGPWAKATSAVRPTSGRGSPGPPPLSQSHQERATDVPSVLLPP